MMMMTMPLVACYVKQQSEVNWKQKKMLEVEKTGVSESYNSQRQRKFRVG